MLVLLIIFLFIFIPLVMLLLHLVRPRMNAQGFLAVLAVIAGWVLVFLARPGLPLTIPLPEWQPAGLFTLSPALVIDRTSWYFALALASLVLAVVVTSIAQLGQSPRSGQQESPKKAPPGEEAGSDAADSLPVQPANPAANHQTAPGWLTWALILVIASLGLLAVTAGNLLTLMLAWAALDFIELAILVGQLSESRTRERIIVAFAARISGLCIVLVAGVMLWAKGASLTFDAITVPVSTVLVLAAGLRLGVLPLHLPYPRGLPIGRNLATVLHLVPTMAGYILLVRVADIGVITAIAPYLMGFTILAGLYAAASWLRAKDEIDGRLFWLLGSSTLVIASAILHLPTACLVWSLASLLSGGLIFSLSIRHKKLFPLVLLAIFNVSSLPFSPTWQGTALYQPSTSSGISQPLFILFSFTLLLIQALLLAGFIRHISKGIVLAAAAPPEHVERWVWFLYPFGLVSILVTQLLIGWWLFPDFTQVPLSSWLIGPVVIILSGLIIYFTWRFPQSVHPTFDPGLRSAWDRLFSFDWLYSLLWRLFRAVSRIMALVSTILEGEGGLLWALVIFGLIFVFLQR